MLSLCKILLSFGMACLISSSSTNIGTEQTNNVLTNVLINQNSIPPSDDFSFSEFPNSQEVFVKELKVQNKALHSCKGLKQCLFIIEFSKVLRSNINTLSNNVEPFNYIRKQYGNENYDFIITNRDLIDLKFDEWLTKDLLDFNNGKILSEDNGFTSEQIKTIYFDYISKIGFDKLYNLRRNSKTLKDKALYSYQLFTLFSDYRLY